MLATPFEKKIILFLINKGFSLWVYVTKSLNAFHLVKCMYVYFFNFEINSFVKVFLLFVFSTYI